MTWPWSLDTQPLIAGTDLIRLNTAPGHGFIRQSGVRARYLFSHLSPCTGQYKSRVQGQHRVLVAPNEHGGRQQGGAAEQVQPGHVERGADHGAPLRPLGQRQRDHHQLRAGGVVTHHLRQAEKTEMSTINTLLDIAAARCLCLTNVFRSCRCRLNALSDVTSHILQLKGLLLVC